MNEIKEKLTKEYLGSKNAGMNILNGQYYFEPTWLQKILKKILFK